MLKKKLLIEIDRTIKEIWLKNIKEDFKNNYFWHEDDIKCSFYYHLRRKLSNILKENNLRIYTEATFPEISYRADMVIVKIDSEGIFYQSDVIALFELKFKDKTDKQTEDVIKADIKKFKIYLQKAELYNTQFYFSVIYGVECEYLQWITDKRMTNNWANGRVTELDAGYLNGKIKFEVNSFNEMNMDLNIIS